MDNQRMIKQLLLNESCRGKMFVLLHYNNFEFLLLTSGNPFFQEVHYENYYYGTLTLTVPVKLRNSIFEIAITPETLNINN